LLSYSLLFKIRSSKKQALLKTNLNVEVGKNTAWKNYFSIDLVGGTVLLRKILIWGASF